jgi:hypothetical protein
MVVSDNNGEGATMSDKVKREGETREMRLISRIIRDSKRVPERSLMEFIATRRRPGGDWHSWNDVMIALREACDETINTATLRSWAAVYGVPSAPRRGFLTQEQYDEAIRAANATP